jgi:acyl-CoA dehydrogenase
VRSHKGFEVAGIVAGRDPAAGASTCLGRAERALGLPLSYAAERKQFGQLIGKMQGDVVQAGRHGDGAEGG